MKVTLMEEGRKGKKNRGEVLVGNTERKRVNQAEEWIDSE